MSEKKNAPSLNRIRELIKLMAESKLELMEVDGMRFVRHRYEVQPEKLKQPENPKPPIKAPSDETLAQGLYTLSNLMNNGH